MCNCIIRVVINLTSFSVWPAYLSSLWCMTKFTFWSIFLHKTHSEVFKQAPSIFCKCTLNIIRYICSRSFACPFKLSIAKWNSTALIFCIVFLEYYVDLTDWGLIWLASEMHAKEEYSLKLQGNHNIFGPFHNKLVEISDIQTTDCRLQCICIDFS